MPCPGHEGRLPYQVRRIPSLEGDEPSRLKIHVMELRRSVGTAWRHRFLLVSSIQNYGLSNFCDDAVFRLAPVGTAQRRATKDGQREIGRCVA